MLASSSVAPLVDRLRTTHATPLSSKQTVAPFSTLWRRTALLSTVLSLIFVARFFILLHLAWWRCGLINLIAPSGRAGLCLVYDDPLQFPARPSSIANRAPGACSLHWTLQFF